MGSFFGGLNALGLAILGDYVVRIYDQVRGRPLFVVDRTINMQPTGTDEPSASRTLDDLANKDTETTDVAQRAATAAPVGDTASEASWPTGRAEDDAESLTLLEQVRSLLDDGSLSPQSDQPG